MDRFTTKIHYLVSMATFRYGRMMALTTDDVEELVLNTNEIAEVVIGKDVFTSRMDISKAIAQSIKKLIESKDLVLLNWEKIQELVDIDRIMLGGRGSGFDDYIVADNSLFERPNFISEDQQKSMELAISTSLEKDPEAPLNIATLLDALEWAMVVQQEQLGVRTQRQKQKELLEFEARRIREAAAKEKKAAQKKEANAMREAEAPKKRVQHKKTKNPG